jgi:hypothetical protein
MKTVLKTNTHEIKVASVSPEKEKEGLERFWRDSELSRTDSMLQADRPDYNDIISYRAALREYPQQPDFPNGVRPTL